MNLGLDGKRVLVTGGSRGIALYYEGAKGVIQDEMRQSGFDPVAFNERLGIELVQRDFQELK